MKRIFGLCLLLALSVAACNKNNSNSGTPATVTGFSNLPTGNYSQLQVLQPGDTSMDANGCAAVGSPQGIAQIDARLAAGQVYETTFQAVAGPGQMSVTTQIRNTIVSRSANTLVENLAVVTGSYMGFLAGAISQATCTLDPYNNYSCAYNPAAINNSVSPNTAPACVFAATSTSAEARSSGNYTIPTGQVYRSYEYSSHQAGYINCGNSQFGSGTADFTSITSNEVPAENAVYFCGGTTLYTRYVLTTTNGNIVWALSSERTAIH